MSDSRRGDLVELLDQYRASEPSEQQSLTQMRGFASSLSEPCSRYQVTAHFTASALVMDPELTRVCLVHHARFDRWLQPGGHIEPDDDTVAAAALREAHEETSCQVVLHPTAGDPFDVDVHEIGARGAEAAHLHLDIRFLVVAENPNALAHRPDESHGAEWLTFDQAVRRCDERSLARMLEKARAIADSGP